MYLLSKEISLKLAQIPTQSAFVFFAANISFSQARAWTKDSQFKIFSQIILQISSSLFEIPGCPTSIISTPKASNFVEISSFSSNENKIFAACSPSRKVESSKCIFLFCFTEYSYFLKNLKFHNKAGFYFFHKKPSELRF